MQEGGSRPVHTAATLGHTCLLRCSNDEYTPLPLQRAPSPPCLGSHSPTGLSCPWSTGPSLSDI
jgi:hypothetical protein